MTIKVREGAAVWRELDGETVLLHLESSLYLGLNKTGTVLWPAMVAGTTRDELVARLVDAYGVEEEHAARDVDAFLDACRQQGLLE